MPPYPVRCYRLGCDHLAVYKIAARWSDGVTSVLKTYSLCCEACLPALFREAARRRAACRLAVGETLEPPGVFRVERGRRDPLLDRLADVEARLRGEAGGDDVAAGPG